MTDTKTVTYSRGAKRWIVEGERVLICDEFGYWRKTPEPLVIGPRMNCGHYQGVNDAGQGRIIDWHVVRDVIPA